MYSTKLIILGVLVLLSAFFSGSETALMSLSKSKVDELCAKKVRNYKFLKKLKDNPHKMLITVLIGNNVANTAASAIAALVFTQIFDSAGLGIATGVMTFVLLVFGEITPKAFSHQNATSIALFVARPIYYLQILFFPIVWMFDRIISVVNKISGSKQMTSVTEGEIVAMLKIGAEEGSIEKQERELIENVLEFNDIHVQEVMTPRVVIDYLDSDMTIQNAVEIAIKSTHSRFPVCDGDLDHIIGIISVRQLLKFFDECSPKKKLKTLKLPPPIEIPLSKKINKLFREFQRQHQHMAVVIDEYGGTAGIVTMEDLLEEIVGDIIDEFDEAERPMEVVDKNTVIVSGTALIEDANDFFKIRIGKNDRDTLNSFVQEKLNRFPREGEEIDLPRVKISILKMKKNLIDKLKIRKKTKKTSV
ncbi:HlyC/CorC family transporter [Candidatus Peregrinibacteria bacterium]|nr:HlyC/CorC family transporter [Candidatus Peregrinibacteria bacterium]